MAGRVIAFDGRHYTVRGHTTRPTTVLHVANAHSPLPRCRPNPTTVAAFLWCIFLNGGGMSLLSQINLWCISYPL